MSSVPNHKKSIKRVTHRQDRRRYQCTEITPPHSFQRKVRRHFLGMSDSIRTQTDASTYFQREQDSTDGAAKCHSNSRSGTSAENLTSLCGIPFIFAKKSRDDISRANRIVNAGPLLTHREARSDRQGETDRLDQQGPEAQKALHDKAGDDAFDFRYA